MDVAARAVGLERLRAGLRVRRQRRVRDGVLHDRSVRHHVPHRVRDRLRQPSSTARVRHPVRHRLRRVVDVHLQHAPAPPPPRVHLAVQLASSSRRVAIPTTTTTTTTTAATTTTAESTTTTLATTTTTATTATTAPPPPVAVSGVSELPLDCGSGLRVWRRQETLLASLDGRGLFASTNGGAAWNELGAATEGTGSHGALVRDPANPDVFWVAGAGGVFKTTNGGVGFVNLGGQIDVRSISIGIVRPGRRSDARWDGRCLDASQIGRRRCHVVGHHGSAACRRRRDPPPVRARLLAGARGHQQRASIAPSTGARTGRPARCTRVMSSARRFGRPTSRSRGCCPTPQA